MSPARSTQADNKRALAELRERMRDPLLTALTIALAFWMFVLAPLHASESLDADIVGFFLALATTGALLILSGKVLTAVPMALAITLAAAAAWMRLREPSLLDMVLNATAWTIISAVLIWVVGKAVFAPGRITYHRIMGAILLYLAIGLVFVALYVFIGVAATSAYAGISVKDSPVFSNAMIYLSFGALTTGGSGDIAPLHPFARSLYNVEAMIGQLYPATLLARLVTLEIEEEERE